MSSNPWDDIKKLFNKEELEIKGFSPYMINRILSFNNSTFGMAARFDKYVFWLEPDFLALCYDNLIPKQAIPFFRYVKKVEKEVSEYEVFIKDLAKHFCWTEKDTDRIKPFLIEMFKNSVFLERVLRFTGADKKTMEKYKISLARPLNKEKGIGLFMR